MICSAYFSKYQFGVSFFGVRQLLILAGLFASTILNVIGQEEKHLPEIVTVNYCDLVREPTLYDNKLIRVTVDYLVAFEGSIMSAAECSEKNSWVEFSPQVKTETPRGIWRKFKRLTDTNPRSKNGQVDHPSRQIRATWIGLFRGVKRTELFGKRVLPIGYGHLGSFNFQLTVQKIEQVEKLRLD